jgi:hypothetical protein
MAQQLGENTKVTLDLKTIGMIVGFAVSLSSMYFVLQADIAQAMVLPLPSIDRVEYDLNDELLQMDKDAQDLMVGEVNTPENRVKFQIARDEVSKKLNELKKKPKLASLTFIEDAEFFIEKDSRL